MECQSVVNDCIFLDERLQIEKWRIHLIPYLSNVRSQLKNKWISKYSTSIKIIGTQNLEEKFPSKNFTTLFYFRKMPDSSVYGKPPISLPFKKSWRRN